jgi:hypothetical protein
MQRPLLLLSTGAREMRPANFRFWHRADVAKRPSEVRFRRDSGQQMLRASFSAFDPNRTFAALGSGLLSHRLVRFRPYGHGDRIRMLFAAVHRELPFAA